MGCGNVVWGWKIPPQVSVNAVANVEGAPRLICADAAGLVEVFPTPILPHLSDGAQQLPVAEYDHQERHNQAEDKQADDVRYVVCRLGCPVDRAGCSRTLGAIAAPAKEWWQGPDEGVDPGQGDAHEDLTVIGWVCLSGGHHGAVALIGQDSQGDQGHDAYKVERAHAYAREKK